MAPKPTPEATSKKGKNPYDEGESAKKQPASPQAPSNPTVPATGTKPLANTQEASAPKPTPEATSKKRKNPYDDEDESAKKKKEEDEDEKKGKDLTTMVTDHVQDMYNRYKKGELLGQQLSNAIKPLYDRAKPHIKAGAQKLGSAVSNAAKKTKTKAGDMLQDLAAQGKAIGKTLGERGQAKAKEAYEAVRNKIRGPRRTAMNQQENLGQEMQDKSTPKPKSP